jgi:hypothetical protein
MRTLHRRAKYLNHNPDLFEWANARERRARATSPARLIARRYGLSLFLASLIAELALPNGSDK